jgi:hypothetical protein
MKLQLGDEKDSEVPVSGDHDDIIVDARAPVIPIQYDEPQSEVLVKEIHHWKQGILLGKKRKAEWWWPICSREVFANNYSVELSHVVNALETVGVRPWGKSVRDGDSQVANTWQIVLNESMPDFRRAHPQEKHVHEPE